MSKNKLSQREKEIRNTTKANDKAMSIYTYIYYKDVTKKEVYIPKLVDLCRYINIHDAVRAIASLNSVFVERLRFPNQASNPVFQVDLVSELLDDSIRQSLSVSDWGKSPGKITIFHRRQLLCMLQIALMYCQDADTIKWNKIARHSFGEACFMCNDLLEADIAPSPGVDETFEKIAQAIPSLDFESDQNPLSLVGRAWAMWIQIPQRADIAQTAGHLDLDFLFTKHFNISLRDYISVIIGLWVYCMNSDPISDADSLFGNLVIDKQVVFQQSSINKSTVDIVLSMISRNYKSLSHEIATRPRQHFGSDFTLLRRYPLIEMETDKFVCIDIGFLLNKISDGVFWMLDEASRKEGKDFRAFFGEIYAKYIEITLSRIYKTSKPAYYPNPKFVGQEHEVSDGMIDYKDLVFLYESKGIMFTTQAKYGADAAAIKRDLEAKVADKKGTGQLSQSIGKLIRGEKVRDWKRDLSGVKHIQPIIVVSDAVVSIPQISEFLCNQFNQTMNAEIQKKAVPVHYPHTRRLVTLSTRDIEHLELLNKFRSVYSIVNGYVMYTKPSLPFSYYLARDWFSQYHPTYLQQKETFVGLAFEECMEEITKRLFGGNKLIP